MQCGYFFCCHLWPLEEEEEGRGGVGDADRTIDTDANLDSLITIGIALHDGMQLNSSHRGGC
jgi:hypothetical protein